MKYKVLESRPGTYIYEINGIEFMITHRLMPFVNKYGWALFEIERRKKTGEVLRSGHIATRMIKSELFKPMLESLKHESYIKEYN